ncbi:exonuclease domain-containing protein [Christiangramia forsetii]|uniref:Protein containing exonuclease domain n=2 Tax=Christiangramia forsetii TaxID=411153 RepID=A0M4R6_CHRFK|nr:exonuclease domain-containing protein [Christiangramia forsetii]GGG22848.1 exonuclease [Christiangramia forsetii]CAL67611.1 protein containing exonuclease domain [Christiangramia forsetii KT0803]
MKDVKFAITDIETTGNGIKGNRITEICVIVVQNGKVIDEYSSLVNPSQAIPLYIETLTGINDEMVFNAPQFSEIADEITKITKDCIFVAHNVNFDYNIIRAEFASLDRDFKRKRLCTVRLTKKLIPGLFSYSLGNICTSINIPHIDRHRAKGDCDATVTLFQRCISLDPEFEVINQLLNQKTAASYLPPNFKSSDFEKLPITTGVYFFKDKDGRPLYIGKAKNIKSRIKSHFQEKSNRKYKLMQETYSIDYELTGNELLALLRESELILKFFPKYNKAQKKVSRPYTLTSYHNQKGIEQFALHKNKIAPVSWMKFYTREEAIKFMEFLCEEFQLCPKYCGLQTGVKICDHYKITNCGGVCKGEVSKEEYNARVEKAIEYIERYDDSCLLLEKGRTREEKSFIYLNKGKYAGYGYIGPSDDFNHPEEFKNFLTPAKNSSYADRIVSRYLKIKRNFTKISLSNDEEEPEDLVEHTGIMGAGPHRNSTNRRSSCYENLQITRKIGLFSVH